jgi:hypothetical protein
MLWEIKIRQEKRLQTMKYNPTERKNVNSVRSRHCSKAWESLEDADNLVFGEISKISLLWFLNINLNIRQILCSHVSSYLRGGLWIIDVHHRGCRGFLQTSYGLSIFAFCDIHSAFKVNWKWSIFLGNFLALRQKFYYNMFSMSLCDRCCST